MLARLGQTSTQFSHVFEHSRQRSASQTVSNAYFIFPLSAAWSDEIKRLLAEATALARSLAAGPTFAHGITKTQLGIEWAVSVETAIEMEAQAQAICMATNDFRRAFEAFADKRTPEFAGD